MVLNIAIRMEFIIGKRKLHLTIELIFHSDVKPENCLIKRDPQNPEIFTVMLSDFGLACMEHEKQEQNGGTDVYLPPEAFKYRYVTFKRQEQFVRSLPPYSAKRHDEWSLAVTLCLLLSADEKLGWMYPWKMAHYDCKDYREYVYSQPYVRLSWFLDVFDFGFTEARLLRDAFELDPCRRSDLKKMSNTVKTMLLSDLWK